MEIGVTEIQDIVQGVWQAMFVQEIVPATPGAAACESLRTGFVQIAGAWHGAVACSASETLLRQVASILHDAPPDALSVESLEDALAELTNMVGGNLKALLPAPSYLCIPAVREGADVSSCLPAMTAARQAAFHVDGEPFLVAVFTRSSCPAAAVS